MARLNIVYHPVSGNLKGHISESVLPELKNGKKIDFLFPSLRYLTGIKETLIQNADAVLPGQMYFGTYFTWANRVLDADHQVFRIIGSGEEWLLLFMFLKKIHRLFQELRPGSLSLILKIVTELRESGCSINPLKDIARTCSDIAPYVECLNSLFNVASERRLASSPTLLMLFAEHLKNGQYIPFGDRLVVAGFYEFNPVQRKILNSLFDRYPETTLYLPENTGHPALQYLKPVSEIIENCDYHSTTISQMKQE